MKKPELLSPAGNLENLHVAYLYGADAVYASGKKYGLRARADNFTPEEIKEGVTFAHKHEKKFYITLNIIPHNKDLDGLPEYVKKLENLKIDGVIVSDPGVLSIVKEIAPDMPIHLSTQANNTNYKSATFWHSLGIKRITLARELSFEEIKDIIQKVLKTLELEVFVHGAICISYSGRCLLSSYMINRDANRGDCANPCRWKYTLQEEKRPGEYMPVFEDDKGVLIFNSKDLCLIEHIPDLIKAGVASFKIEGRMKSSYYVAVVTGAYRKAIDDYMKNTNDSSTDPQLREELNKINNRHYTKGFFSKKPDGNEYIYDSSGYTYAYIYCGIVLDYDEKKHLAVIRQQNKMMVGDHIEIIGPGRSFFTQEIKEMFDAKNNPINTAPHPQQIIRMKVSHPVKPFDMIRKKSPSMSNKFV